MELFFEIPRLTLTPTTIAKVFSFDKVAYVDRAYL